LKLITCAVLAAALVPLAACSHASTASGAGAGAGAGAGQSSGGGGAASTAPAQSSSPPAGGASSSPPAQTSSHHGGGKAPRCPLSHSQTDAALQTSTRPPIRKAALGVLCSFRTSKSNSFALGVTIQRFPLPGQTIKTLSQAYTSLNAGSSDQVTREPSWGSGAFLDVTSTPDFTAYTGYIPGYEVQLNVPIEDEARTAQAPQIVRQLVDDVLH
jgi:hypothetical protein